MIIILSAAAIALAPAPVRSLTIQVEAEDFVDFYESGLYTLIRENLGRLEGLDYPGEWTEYNMNVSDYGTYSFVLLCWGDFNVPYHLKLYVKPILGGDTQTIDINFIGKGCFG
jgi:hypothetical protein